MSKKDISLHMAKYEYQVLDSRIVNDATNLTIVLNSLGREGWEFVCADDKKLYLKREKSTEQK